MKHASVWASLGLLWWLAAGAAAAWVALGIFAVSQWESSRRNYRSESLLIRHDGEAIIKTDVLRGNAWAESTQRTLDGEEIAGTGGDFSLGDDLEGLRSAQLETDEPARWGDGPLTWQERIATLDTKNGRWVLVHDGTDEGRVYFIKFDNQTKQRVGYLGRRGMRMGELAADEMFRVGPAFRWRRSHRVAGTRLNIYGYYYHQADVVDPVPSRCIYLVDDGDLVEVDTASQRVRTIIDGGDVRSVELVEAPNPAAADEIKKMSAGPWKQPKIGLSTQYLLARLSDRLAVLKPTEDGRVDFMLPEEFRDVDLNVYVLGDDQLLLARATIEREGWRRHELTWIDNEGRRVREAEVELESYRGEGPGEAAMVSALVLPTLITFALVVFLAAPLEASLRGPGDTYLDGVRAALTECWPAGLGLLLVSVTAAWLVVRWQRQSGRTHTAWWAAAVFLLGVPGLIGYRLLFGRAWLRTCPACKRETSQRDQSCRRCGEAFPAPQLTGAEVFA